jgi:hypothetical protein
MVSDRMLSKTDVVEDTACQNALNACCWTFEDVYCMKPARTLAPFSARLLRPAVPGCGVCWAFLVLPKAVSALLPRRGRTTVDGRIQGVAFRETLEPDGELSHWLRLDLALLQQAGVVIGETVTLEIEPVVSEPEPALPEDWLAALAAAPEARATWDKTTTLARVDWIHWIVSAKQARTRAQRLAKACDMLASGERRVCCFDNSGFYSKALKAPRAVA